MPNKFQKKHPERIKFAPYSHFILCIARRLSVFIPYHQQCKETRVCIKCAPKPATLLLLIVSYLVTLSFLCASSFLLKTPIATLNENYLELLLVFAFFFFHTHFIPHSFLPFLLPFFLPIFSHAFSLSFTKNSTQKKYFTKNKYWKPNWEYYQRTLKCVERKLNIFLLLYIGKNSQTL